MRVKNDSGSEQIWCGQTIANGSHYDVSVGELFKWQSDDKVITDVGNLDLLVGDGSSYKDNSSDAINFLLGIDTTPKDLSGRPIQRSAATIDGWHYQINSIEITTADKDGYYHKDENGNDIGFITHKIYDSNDAEITDAANEGNAVKTCVWFRPNHSHEIIGAIFSQASAPNSNIRMWVTGLPGIYNIKFGNGGINLKHIGVGTFQIANGRASKYLAYNAQVVDANSFKLTLKHDQGAQHTFQIHFELYKAV
jgi:hypothetical protein